MVSDLFPGGSAISIYNLLKHTDPELVTFTGLVVCDSHLEQMEPPPGFSTPVYSADSFKEVCGKADLIMGWGPCDWQRRMQSVTTPLLVVSRGGNGCQFTDKWLTEALPVASYYAAVSHDAKNPYPPELRSKVRVIWNSFDPERLEPTKDRERCRQDLGFSRSDRVVGYMGRISYEKGLEKIIDVVAMMPDDWKLLIINTKPIDAEYANSVEERLEWTIPGRYVQCTPGTQVGNALCAMDVMLMLSDVEGCCNAVIEAWHLEIPVVYYPRGVLTDMRDEIGTVGLELDPDDPDVTATEIAGSTMMLLQEKAKEEIEGGRRAAQRLVLSRHLRSWSDFFRECVDDCRQKTS